MSDKLPIPLNYRAENTGKRNRLLFWIAAAIFIPLIAVVVSIVRAINAPPRHLTTDIPIHVTPAFEELVSEPSPDTQPTSRP